MTGISPRLTAWYMVDRQTPSRSATSLTDMVGRDAGFSDVCQVKPLEAGGVVMSGEGA